jgi:Ca2+-binding EF-hand superfamily protein
MKVFELFDEENTGFITFKSLKRVCEELNESLYVMCLLACLYLSFFNDL